MEKLSWKASFWMFIFPAICLAVIAAFVHVNDWIIKPGHAYEGTFQPLRAWTAAWIVAFLVTANFFPLGPFNGGKIIRSIFGHFWGKIIGFLFIGIFSWFTKLWFLGLILILIHIAGILVYRKIHQISEKPKQLLRTTRWQTAVALLLYTAMFALSVVYLGVSAAKIGQLKVPRAVRSDAVVAENGWVDVRGQIHIHSFLSHDSDGTFEEIAKAAKANGVRWVILTDHISKLPKGFYPDEIDGVLFIYGNERSWKEGSSRFRASLKDKDYSLFLFGHIEKFGSSGDPKWDSWDAIELVNFHANSFENVRDLVGCIFGNPSGIYPLLAAPLTKNLDYWQKLAEKEGRPVPIFSGPDAHQNVRPLGILLDPYELMLSLTSTHIWIPEGEELNQETIFEAIKKGRTYIAFDYLGDPTGFQFWAERGYEEKFFTGETVTEAQRLVIKNPLPGTEMKLIRNNVDTLFTAALQRESYSSNFYYKNPEPGFWRVEIWKDGKLWIMSGQILVK